LTMGAAPGFSCAYRERQSIRHAGDVLIMSILQTSGREAAFH
jgi:hypothetical protein